VDPIPTLALLDAALVYHWIDGNVYRKSTGRQPAMMQLGGFCGISSLRGDYHQQYLAKNPGGYCPDHSCGVAFKSAELQVGEKA
jgi:hypothetical protein